MAYIKTKTSLEILVDDNKFEELNQYKWSISRDGYAYAQINKKRTAMHRYLTNCPKGMFVDHINLKKLDNRMDNLEIVTPQENTRRWKEHERSRQRDENGYLVPYSKSVQRIDENF